MDDGGLVSEILHSDKKYKGVMNAFKIVEQTTRGITAAEELTLEVPLVNVALSMSKKVEGVLIGRSVSQKVLQGLNRLGKTNLKGKSVTLVGYGTVGKSIAEAMKKAGAKVNVIEASPLRAAEAKRAGFNVTTKDKALKNAEILVGATGSPSISVEDLKLLPDGAVVASASSKQLEIDMDGLNEQASKRASS